jgi:farnesyl diphosphate synthase
MRHATQRPMRTEMSTTEPTNFETKLRDSAAETQALLMSLLSSTVEDDEIARPENLMAAMRHGTLNGGKRLRPFLVVESAALFGTHHATAMRIGAALECLHCYSLIHDDLPAMDDDDLRRGQPTVHKAFDEAVAILAGDSLLTFAFDIIAAPQTDLPAERKVQLTLALARASGVGGMAGGQALDLAAEKNPPDETGIRRLQSMKTGALLRFACEAGPIIAGAPDEDRKRMRLFGEKIGLAFQLADDLLDVTSDAATLGKATGKDAGRGKGTLVGLYGIEWAEKTLDTLTEEALDLLSPYGENAAILREAARFIADRKS